MAKDGLRLPYGITDFMKIRREGYYYCDKTQYIPLLEQDHFIIFLRPRRFGKSLLLNVLDAYYNVKYADRFDELFSGLAIGDTPTPLRGSYLVLKFNFSTVDSNPRNVQESFHENVMATLRSFVRAYASHLPDGAGQRIMADGVTMPGALTALFDEVQTAGQRLYVMIDEYDNFANSLMTIDENGYNEAMHGEGYVRLFYNVLKAGTTANDAAIDRIFITGVSPLCLSDVTSGFNIGINYSLEPDFNGMAGFTEKEAREMLSYYSRGGDVFRHTVDELVEVMRPYYDNHCFSDVAARRGEHMFNSNMVLYFIKKYMGNYGEIPKQMLDPNARSDYNKVRMMVKVERSFGDRSRLMQDIVNNGYHDGDLTAEFRLNELTQPDKMASLLFYLGLLTYGQAVGMTTLVVANEAMREQYRDYLATCYAATVDWRTDINTMNRLWGSWSRDGLWRPMVEYIASVMHDNDSVRDHSRDGEAFVKGFMLAHICAGQGYLVQTEREAGHGYSDITLTPIREDYRHALVLELKYCRPGSADADVERLRSEAVAQVARYAADKGLKKGQEAKGKKLHAGVAVFRGWTLEVVEDVKID